MLERRPAELWARTSVRASMAVSATAKCCVTSPEAGITRYGGSGRSWLCRCHTPSERQWGLCLAVAVQAYNSRSRTRTASARRSPNSSKIVAASRQHAAAPVVSPVRCSKAPSASRGSAFS